MAQKQVGCDFEYVMLVIQGQGQERSLVDTHLWVAVKSENQLTLCIGSGLWRIHSVAGSRMSC